MKRTIVALIIIFLIGIFAGVSLFHLFTNDSITHTATVIDHPARLLARVTAKEHLYKKRIDSINEINFTLQSKVTKTQSALRQVKRQNTALQLTVNDLLNIHYTEADTTLKLDNCDSIAATLQDLLILNVTKDSLYENLVTDQQTQVFLRDSVIELQQAHYDTLKVSYTSALGQQQALLEENAAQRKVIRKQKKGKVMLSVLLASIGIFIAFSSGK